jgi:hypothetical protein
VAQAHSISRPQPSAEQSVSQTSNAQQGTQWQQSNQSGADEQQQSGNPNSIVNGPNDWGHSWLRNVDKARSEQPHDVAPLITTHVLLVQQYRFD